MRDMLAGGVATESKGTAGNCSQLECVGELHANSNENMKTKLYFFLLFLKIFEIMLEIFIIYIR